MTTVTREMIGAAHDVMLANGDFVLSAALHAECEALRADAGRWRWLRSRPPETPTNGPDFVLWVECYGEAPRNEKADAAVDAAMAKDRTK